MGASECGMWLIKYILCFFNFIFFVLGTIIVGAGAWLALDKNSLLSILRLVKNENIEHFAQPAIIEQSAILLIIIGAICFFISFLGYCGAVRESRCLLSTYALFMVVLLIAEIALGGLLFGYKDKVKEETKNFLSGTISRYYKSVEERDAVTLMWDHIMVEFQCCGVNNFHDFEKSADWMEKKGNKTIPETCCIMEDSSPMHVRFSECTTDPTESNSYMNKGCYDAFLNWIISHRDIVVGVLLGVAAIELFAIFLTICLYRSIAKHRAMRL